MSTAVAGAPALLTAQRLIAMSAAAILLGTGLMASVAAPSHAVTWAENGITYDLNEAIHTAVVTRYDANSGPVVNIPETVHLNGEPFTVTTLGGAAFYNNRLTAVTIPESITTIGESTFATNRLSELALPDSLTAIGPSAFDSNQLTDVMIPEFVTTIGDGAFGNNADLVAVTFDANGGTNIAPASVTDGDRLPSPTDNPIREGYTFTGWYSDAENTALYDFDTKVTGEVTLYAGWEKHAVNPEPGEDPTDQNADADAGPDTGSDAKTDPAKPPTSSTPSTLPRTGSAIHQWALFAGAGMLLAGASVLLTRRTARARIR